MKNSELAGVLAFCMLAPTWVFAGQPLETETARLPTQGHGNVQGAFEFQTSSEGKESAIPLVFEYGITDRLELAIEPVARVSLKPKIGRRVSGFGDVEATLTYLLAQETDSRPAFALATEVKFGTAKDQLIGTGKDDIRFFGIASKRFGKLDLHANLGYTFPGSPRGVKLENYLDYALAMTYDVNEKTKFVAEILGNGASAPGESQSGANPLTAEAAGSELVGLIGISYQLNDNVDLAFGITRDNNNATTFRPAITISF
jgi:hypothetical protein